VQTSLPGVEEESLRRVQGLLAPLGRYHRFRVEGMEHVPRTGPCLLAVHHSLATYDGFLLGGAIYDATGRLPRGLGDDRIFQLPWLGGLARRVGLTPASPAAGEDLLRAGHILAVAPGGMWESLRPRDERRRSRWKGRKGFVRLALRCGAPLLIAACPGADDVFTVYPSRVTDRVYRRLHLPLPVARGVGPTLLPRPVALTHFLAPLLVPPPHDQAYEDDQVDTLHAEACRRMADLLARE
jgi:1-acyl-sn-glycerol-3-phosphate acyltransferase